MGSDVSKPNSTPAVREVVLDGVRNLLLQESVYYEQAILSHLDTFRSQLTGTGGRPVPAPRPRTGEYPTNRNNPVSTIPMTNRGSQQTRVTIQSNSAATTRAPPTVTKTNITTAATDASSSNRESQHGRKASSGIIINIKKASPTPRPINTHSSETAYLSDRESQQNRVSALTNSTTAPSRAPPTVKTTNTSTAASSSNRGSQHGQQTVSSSITNNTTKASPTPRLINTHSSATANLSDRSSQSSSSRARSVSRSRTQSGCGEGGNLHACCTCELPYGARIYTCPYGHSSCSGCRESLALCGLCGANITSMRNLTLELYIAELKGPCPNAKDGCCLHFKQNELESHLKECPFSEMKCPLCSIYKDCLWRGKLSQVSEHVSTAHPQNCHIHLNREAYMPNICFEDQVMHFVTMGPYKFIFTIKVCPSDCMVYVLAQLLGTQMSASKWSYEIQVYNKREPRRKYQYVDVCQSASVPINDIIKDANCAAIPLRHALTYINEGGVAYKLFLKKIAGYDRRTIWNKNYRGSTEDAF